jgi:hypothetical protein
MQPPKLVGEIKTLLGVFRVVIAGDVVVAAGFAARDLGDDALLGAPLAEGAESVIPGVRLEGSSESAPCSCSNDGCVSGHWGSSWASRGRGVAWGSAVLRGDRDDGGNAGGRRIEVESVLAMTHR